MRTLLSLEHLCNARCIDMIANLFNKAYDLTAASLSYDECNLVIRHLEYELFVC
eukprot:c13831_g1_i1 orf=135-296(-)